MELILNLILIRGLPGSGKSTTAKSFSDDFVHLETDMFWYDINRNYNFDISRIKEAHEWCQRVTREYLELGNDVVVSNTFTTKKELKPYFDLAKCFNIVPQVILCQNQFQNVHNVPQEALDRMKARFEYDISELFGEL